MEDQKPAKPEVKPQKERSVREFRFMALCLGVLAAFAVGYVLYLGQSVLVPLVFAWLLSYVFAPLIKFFTRRRVPTALTVAVVIGVLVVVLSLLALVISRQVAVVVQMAPEYYDRFLVISRDFAAKFHVPPDFWNTIDWSSELRRYLFSASSSAVKISSKFAMTVFFLVFILLGSPYSEVKLRRAFLRASDRDRVSGILDSISLQISKFVSTQTLISAATGLCVWAAMAALGVDMAGTWGLLAFLLNFIPTVGSIVASIPPIVVAVVQFYPSLWMPVAVASSLLVIQMTIGNIISPKVMGDNLHLSPVTVLVSLLVWGLIWGIPGALLSVPMACMLKIVFDAFPSCRPLAVLFGSGRTYAREEKNS